MIRLAGLVLSIVPALVLALLLAACGESAAHVDTGPAEPDPPPVDPTHLFKRSRALMGTIYEITVAGERDDHAAPVIQRALNEVARLEDVLSEWRPGTEISRINDAAGREPIRVSPDTMIVVESGVEISRQSGGAFDLSWAALRGMYLFQPGEERIPDAREIRARLPLVSWEDIVVDEAASTVFLRREGMALGTGGIAKGYALDRAAAILIEGGIANFMVFGGGQVLVHGRRGDRPWRVGIQHPRRNDFFGFIEADRGSVATAGDYEHFFIRDGRRWHHIIDPETGYPVTHTVSVTVLAPTGLDADAIDTACFVMGAERCLQMMARLPGDPEAVIVTAEGRVITTPGTRDRLRLTVELDHDVLPGVAGPRPAAPSPRPRKSR